MPKNKQSSPSIRRHRPVYQLPLFWVILIAVLVGGAFVVKHVLATKKQPSTPTSSTQASSSASSSSTTSKASEPSKEPTSQSAPSSDASGGKTPVQYDGEDPNTSATLTGTLTAARFSGDQLIIRVNIDQFLSSGTCHLAISDGTHQLQKDANLVSAARTSTCEGFDLASSELSGFARPLYITISLTSGDKFGIIEGRVE